MTATMTDRARRRSRASRRACATGDTVGVVAPASSWENRSELLRGVAGLEAWGLRSSSATTSTTATATWPAATRTARRTSTPLLADPEVRAIVCLQGGYGTPRLIPLLDEAAVRRQPEGDLRLQRPDDAPSRRVSAGAT